MNPEPLAPTTAPSAEVPLGGTTASENPHDQFIAACRSAHPPALAELGSWLGRFPAEQRADALVDLVSLHLPRCWELGRRHLLEDYVRALHDLSPEFASPAALPLDLIEVEFVACHEFPAFCDHPRLGDYRERFPGRADVEQRLRRRCLDGERYVKVRLEGQGGLGLVWCAYDQHLRRQVAIKEPQPARGGARVRAGFGARPHLLRRLREPGPGPRRAQGPAGGRGGDGPLPGAPQGAPPGPGGREGRKAQTATMLNNLGLAYERAGQLRQANELYVAAIRIDPRSSSALRNRSLVHSRAGRFADAEADLRKALALRPGTATCISCWATSTRRPGASPRRSRLTRRR
jgi:tetratricopeptide (TPR) repeat protein